ncbi:MAG: molybdopterin molybdenumtransferase MoeA [Nitrospirae bacterium]|nr:MAG: molybdopterin molybdenumtransferase MoeA [Nitrospirota bacterium]
MKDVLGRGELLPVKEAEEMLLSLPFAPTGTEIVSLENAYGRILCEDIFSREELPGFDRSTMDGYAVRSSDTFGATETTPQYLKIRGEVLMGKVPEFEILPGEAAKIPTGGMLPAGADSVIMLEDTNMVSPTLVEVFSAVGPGENIIRRDEDLKRGELILKKGSKLRPQDVAALGGMGITRIPVFKKPVVTLISTGDEILPSDKPIQLGKVRDVNSHNLYGLVLEHGGIPVRAGILRDDFELIRDTVLKAIDASEVVLITGGSSAGTRDYIERVLESIEGSKILFHGVSIKPGKPLLVSVVEDRKIVYGLPGHPAAVSVSFLRFVRPVLRRFTGEVTPDVKEHSRRIRAFLSENISSLSGREDNVRVRLHREDGRFIATPVLGKSGLIMTLVRADGLIRIPPEKTGLYEGEEVVVELF